VIFPYLFYRSEKKRQVLFEEPCHGGAVAGSFMAFKNLIFLNNLSKQPEPPEPVTLFLFLLK